MLKLYSYFRSSAAYRVRIALALKGLDFELVPVHLLKAWHQSDDYITLNPQGLVPTLQADDAVLVQSLAILEYLEETDSRVPLLPSDPICRAHVRAMCQMIACDTHPLNNLKVLNYLSHDLGISDAQKRAWYAHWIHENFKALEVFLQQHSGKFCYGDQPTMADCCLVPQVYNALRFDVDLSAYPNIVRIYEYCNQLPAFIEARPEHQMDYDL